eukprot:gene1511-1534_t
MLGYSSATAPGPLASAKTVNVPRGTNAEIGALLEGAGVASDALSFHAAAVVTMGKGPLKAGEFTFPEHVSLLSALAILRSGKAVQHKLTIPEGLTAAQIAQLLDRAPALDGETPVPNEGEMMPETYSYTYGTARTALVERARAAMDRNLAKIWAARDANLPLAAPADLLTLASIVERETSRPEERARVAAVFLNRLRRGMKLQSDPTTAYAVSGGLVTNDRGLTKSDLDSSNPYNTYTAPGLPPGPIASPGLASMQAVAKPEPSEDLYFVADGQGGHVFAKTSRSLARYGTEQLAEVGDERAFDNLGICDRPDVTVPNEFAIPVFEGALRVCTGGRVKTVGVSSNGHLAKGEHEPGVACLAEIGPRWDGGRLQRKRGGQGKTHAEDSRPCSA